ncbi:DUF3829 domain-containing protein [Pseudomonas sp. ABY48]|uniref:DUF3829 domain-containing protein n=1 Tax=Pseudomonas sp. ABY48 TaxID=3402865 RepID=UPI003B42FD63
MISTRAFITAVVVLLTMAWLVQRVSSSETVDKATLSSWSDIQAISTCLVEGAELLEQRYADYHAVLAPSKDVWPTWRGFVGFGMGSDDILRTQAPCKPWFHSDDANLNAQAKNYVKAYDRLRPDALAIERWLGDRSNELPSPELDRLEQAFNLNLQDVRAQAIPLRQALEQPQLHVREQQLAAIETRLGHDQHWQTLRFMILARQTINALDAMTEGAPLSPEHLLTAQQTLTTRWTEAETLVQALPRLRSANGTRPVWTHISFAAKEWLTTLERLQQHWASGADADELNRDLAAARAGYDELQSRYNTAVKSQY